LKSWLFFKDFFVVVVVEKSQLCSPRPHLFDQKYSTNSNIVKF